MSTNRPPLIFRITVPVTTWPSSTDFIISCQRKIFSALILLSWTMPWVSSIRPEAFSTSSTNTWMVAPSSGGFSSSSHSRLGMLPSLLYPMSNSTTSLSTRIMRPSTILFDSINVSASIVASPVSSEPASAALSSCSQSVSLSKLRMRFRLTMFGYLPQHLSQQLLKGWICQCLAAKKITQHHDRRYCRIAP